MKSSHAQVGGPIKRNLRRQWIASRAAILGLIALSITVGGSPINGHQTHHYSKAWVERLEAIEEKNPYRLRDLVGNGRPTLIAFIDHLCHTCLKSVEPVDQLKKQFSGRVNIVVIDPSRITRAHSWAKDRYRVWFVPKFVIADKHGQITWEYSGPTSAQTLAANLQWLLAS